MIKHWKKLLLPLVVGAIIYAIAGGPAEYSRLRGIVVDKAAAEEEQVNNNSRFTKLVSDLTHNVYVRSQLMRPLEKDLPTERNKRKSALAKLDEAKKEQSADLASMTGFYAHPSNGWAANSRNQFLITYSDESALIDSLIATVKHDPKANSQQLKFLDDHVVFAAHALDSAIKEEDANLKDKIAAYDIIIPQLDQQFRNVRIKIALAALFAIFGSVALLVALLFQSHRPQGPDGRSSGSIDTNALTGRAWLRHGSTIPGA
jgi:delta 1-pyrroline-5-carboxylate dehydrogenase